jgi:N utilization substance protein B
MRRIIRIKAMQALYSFYQNKEVNLHEMRRRAEDGLIEIPSYYNATTEEKSGYRALLPILLDDAFAGKLNAEDLLENQKWLTSLAEVAVEEWNNENIQQRKRISEKIRADLTRQSEKEVLFWTIFRDLIHQVESEEDNRRNAFLNAKESPEHLLKILSHPFLALLQTGLQPANGPAPKSFLSVNPEWIQRLYPVLFRELPEYIAFRDLPVAGPEEEQSIWKVLYRKLLRSDILEEIMGEADLHWSENRILLEVALKEQFQQLCAGNPMNFSRNKEDEEEMLSFFNQLFDSCMDNMQSDELKLAAVISNWDPERVSPVDKYLILLAINEMRSFPHIPVKVTINEYLEIAKAYSGPNATGFINGVTDRMAKVFQKEGLIKKSAKGMMDNR